MQGPPTASSGRRRPPSSAGPASRRSLVTDGGRSPKRRIDGGDRADATPAATVARQASVGMLATADGTARFVNEAFLDLFDLDEPPDAFAGRDCDAIVERIENRLRSGTIAVDGRIDGDVERFMLADGRTIVGRQTSIRLDDGDRGDWVRAHHRP